MSRRFVVQRTQRRQHIRAAHGLGLLQVKRNANGFGLGLLDGMQCRRQYFARERPWTQLLDTSRINFNQGHAVESGPFGRESDREVIELALHAL